MCTFWFYRANYTAQAVVLHNIVLEATLKVFFPANMIRYAMRFNLLNFFALQQVLNAFKFARHFDSMNEISILWPFQWFYNNTFLAATEKETHFVICAVENP